jgi:ribonuclease HI
LTIPRLELQAAVLAIRLAQSILHESRLQFENIIFFSDSSIVISWIRSRAREFKPELLKYTANPNLANGELNVADEVSRGIPAQELTETWTRIFAIVRGTMAKGVPTNNKSDERGPSRATETQNCFTTRQS